jgi:two-component system response regulator MprA
VNIQPGSDRLSRRHHHPPVRILVVDDDEAIRTLLNTLFSEEGYEVQLASQGQQALETIERSSFDVVLTDMSMPVMDGWELARALKDRGAAIPLVVMTAGRSVAAVAGDVDAAAYIGKPFDIDAVLLTIDRVVHGEESPRAS